MLKFVRKVGRGSASLYLTLPAAWVRTYNVRPGTLLDVESEGRALKIRVAGASPASPVETRAPTPGQEAGNEALSSGT